MALIAQTHLQYIIEIAVILQLAVIFILNLAPLGLNLIMLVAMVVALGFALMFGVDALFLFIPGFSHSEFTHPYGPLALLAVVTIMAAIPIMKKSGINTRSLQIYMWGIIIFITIAGGLMHRSFLLLWIFGLFIGFFIISKSFRQKSVFTVKRVAMVMIVALAGFGALELLSRVLDMSVLSPLLRLSRIENYATASLDMVIKNTTLTGHQLGSCYWGDACMGGSDGYISLPIALITLFGLPFPLFYGLLVTKKDVIDYMLPGIFGVAFDFGYIFLVFLLGWFILVMYLGFRMLRSYRKRRENGDKTCLGREALLIGSLTAFIAQGTMGLFLMNRSINGTALLTFLLLSALVVGHVVLIKKK
ncbi:MULTISPECIES: hypothetical protein [Methanobacterium]|jgi:hypothetical protein|uniref:Uncharacterized protein n=1 Tax=Methanobacterium formicicum TaxID=2162 RepID=A0A090JYQ5_METFO|nr:MULTISPECIES: hypothetical protein [Methanobacterium]KUK74178.1 MAG: Uncharacterized protein XD90_1376 [Methanobacterium sp. 42_16]MDD4811180.1 hypothetical protein [Methanobacterium formicicum]MDG3546426.1 hypothetical protein [Methanobacterium formicicum]MDH2659624.1 hypothetical protein [Methanobacterium formicicum]CEA14833.1 hypothetical protein DSM1535_2397 [Methanobacterium formicicum]